MTVGNYSRGGSGSQTDQYGSNSTWSSGTSLSGDTLTTTGDETTTTIDADGNSDTWSYSYSDTTQVDSAWAQTAGGNPPGIPSPGGAATVLGWVAAVLPGFQMPSDTSGGGGEDDPPPPTTTSGVYDDGTSWTFTDDGSSWSYEERDANGNVIYQNSGTYDTPPDGGNGSSAAQQALGAMFSVPAETPPAGGGSSPPMAQRIPNWVPGTPIPISDGVYRPGRAVSQIRDLVDGKADVPSTYPISQPSRSYFLLTEQQRAELHERARQAHAEMEAARKAQQQRDAERNQQNLPAGAGQWVPPPIPDDPTKPPGPGWKWEGPGAPGTPNGEWVGPNNERLHPDLQHPKPKGPHWTYRLPGNNRWDYFPDTGKWVPHPRNRPDRPTFDPKDYVGPAVVGVSLGAIIYIIISEGSRLFPPRNLIPIP